MATPKFNMEDFGFTRCGDPTPKRDIRGRFRKQDSCCICGGEIGQFGGNNPEPFMSMDEGQCCDDCNEVFVIPARMRELVTA